MDARVMEKTWELKKFYPGTKMLLKRQKKRGNLNLNKESKYYSGQYKNSKTNFMCYHLKTNFGGTEAVIDDNCGISKFYSIADTLEDGLNVRFINQVDDSETLDWDFRYRNHCLTLHYNIFNGVSILPHNAKAMAKPNKAVCEVAKFLERNAY